MPSRSAILSHLLPRWFSSNRNTTGRLNQPVDTGRSHIRPLAEAIDHALHLGRFTRAQRLIDTAQRIAPSSPALLERVARLRLALGDPATALSVLESFHRRTASARMLRMVCLVHVGRFDDAISELRHWTTRSTAPLTARRLLAILEHDLGHTDDAIKTLYENLLNIEDPRTLRCLIAMHHAAGRPHRADALAGRLLDTAIGLDSRADARRFLASLGMLTCNLSERPSQRQIECLATELIACEDAIEPLLRAQQRRPDPRAARLLRDALQRCVTELTDQMLARRAIAELSVILSNQNAIALGRSFFSPAIDPEAYRAEPETPSAVVELVTHPPATRRDDRVPLVEQAA